MSTKIIAVTGCPTGIAHTFMAEEALKKAAAAAGVEIKVETNGASGVGNALTDQDIADADCVIIAADKDVNAGRFNGKKVIETSVKDGITNAKKLIERAVSGDVPVRQGSANDVASTPASGAEAESAGRVIYKHLMSGVSNMLPFVVAGGILIAISFLWGIHSFDPKFPEEYNEIAASLMKIGGQSFGIMVPVFTAFIASSIAGRSGMVAGFVGGLLANTTGSGFLGGIIAGFASGYFMLWLNGLMSGMPRHYEGLKSIFILPVLGVLFSGTLMILLGEPVSALNAAAKTWLSGLQHSSPIVLGTVLGIMIAFDFGGPINKAAYVTGTILLAEGNYHFMAGVSAACMTPPFVVAFATTFFRKAFTDEEKAAGMVCYILGATHITEGAIPFAAKDPIRVIPIMMLASAISAILSFMFGITVPAPHGGFLVLPLVNSPIMWFAAIMIGSAVGAFIYGVYRVRTMKENLA